eukprot:849512-Pyramimonas_sp.AAC.1
MREWVGIWDHPGVDTPTLLTGASTWDDLPTAWDDLSTISVRDVRDALLQFPWAAGVGQYDFTPRNLIFISDGGLQAL